jgi:hypothetical protein
MKNKPDLIDKQIIDDAVTDNSLHLLQKSASKHQDKSNHYYNILNAEELRAL